MNVLWFLRKMQKQLQNWLGVQYHLKGNMLVFLALVYFTNSVAYRRYIFSTKRSETDYFVWIILQILFMLVLASVKNA